MNASENTVTQSGKGPSVKTAGSTCAPNVQSGKIDHKYRKRQFLLRCQSCPKIDQRGNPGKESDRIYRSLGLREDNLVALPQPDERSDTEYPYYRQNQLGQQ